MKITATLVAYYHTCRRKMYLHAHGILMEHTSDIVYEGKLIGESSYGERAERNSELAFSLPATPEHGEVAVKIDYYDPVSKTVHETKKSDKMEGAHRAQVLFYLWALEQFGVEGARGVLEYPRLRSRETVVLSDEDRAAIGDWVRGMDGILNGEVCPPVMHKPVCRSCAYQDYCFSGE